jgi:hypothetical protein
MLKRRALPLTRHTIGIIRRRQIASFFEKSSMGGSPIALSLQHGTDWPDAAPDAAPVEG